jgi:hypothetical protein
VRAATSTGKHYTRLSGILVQPFILSVVNDGDDTSIRVVEKIAIFDFVVIDESESLGRENVLGVFKLGYVREEKKLFPGLRNSRLFEGIEILGA